MDDIDYCSAFIGQLRDRGYSVSIDDFGTGHASLAYLKHLPVTTLKIDQAFVRDLATNVDDQTITRAIVEMAGALRLRCVAEGIENEESAAAASRVGLRLRPRISLPSPMPLRRFPGIVRYV